MEAMRNIAIFAATFAALLAFASLARTDEWTNMDHCLQNGDLSLKIDGCTAIIDSGEWSPEVVREI